MISNNIKIFTYTGHRSKHLGNSIPCTRNKEQIVLIVIHYITINRHVDVQIP